MALKDRIAERSPGSGYESSADNPVTYFRRLLLQEVEPAELCTLNPTHLRARLERVVGRLLSREGPVLSTAERGALIRQIVDEALGLGVLEPLLADPSITEIMVNGHDNVWIERRGRIERVEGGFATEEQLYQTIDRIVSAVNRRVDESSPMVDARLPTGERVNVIVPPLSLTGPTITIRRFPRPYALSELIELGSLDQPMCELLEALVRARLNILISGGTGTGKTTLLNSLSASIPAGERIITIEDAAELSLAQEHVISLESRPANVEGKGQITIRELVRNSLRMRPDRIVVGEVRGGEALDMLQAMNTGHEGSLCTVHANSPDDAIHRLGTLATMSDLNVPFDALRDQVNSAIDVVVHLARTGDGCRRIAEVAVVASRRQEEFRLETVARFAPDVAAADRGRTGQFEHHPVPPGVLERLALAGEAAPAPFAGRPARTRTTQRKAG